MERIYRSLLIPAFESGLKGRRTFTYWQDLERSQWLSPELLAERQLRSLRRLLAKTFDDCPWYRSHWLTRGLDPDKVETLTDFHRWPLIDRDTIRAHRIAMRSTAPGTRLVPKTTGGSSGAPLAFDIDVESYQRRFAAWFHGYGWAAAPPGTKQWYLWGGSVGDVPGVRRWKDRLYHTLYRRRLVNSFELTEATVPTFLSSLNSYRPDAIVAYASPLYTFARCLAERGLRPYSPRSIIVGAEKLYDFQRAQIEEVFQSPVFETYGSREFMLIGAECDRHAGLHLTMENLLVEVVDDNGAPTPAGREGNVAITDLTNYGMPFIRYLNGDRALSGFELCSCGRGLPLLKKVVGRTLDMLQTPDGRHVPGEFFPHLLKEYPAVRRFQVVQEALDRIELRVVVNGEWSHTQNERLERQIRAVVGTAVSFRIGVVGEIPLTPAGKLQVVVRRV